MSGFGVAVVSTVTFGEIQSNSDGAEDMTWEYRVVFAPYEEGGDEGEYTIREVYYDDEGEISWWSDEGIAIIAEDFWDLANDFDMMAEAFLSPVLVLVGDELVEDDEEYEYEDEESEEEEDEEEA